MDQWNNYYYIIFPIESTMCRCRSVDEEQLTRTPLGLEAEALPAAGRAYAFEEIHP